MSASATITSSSSSGSAARSSTTTRETNPTASSRNSTTPEVQEANTTGAYKEVGEASVSTGADAIVATPRIRWMSGIVYVLVIVFVSVYVEICRQRFEVFGAQYILPHAKLEYMCDLTLDRATQRLVWVACTESESTCATNRCLLSIFDGNVTASTALCEATAHTCAIRSLCGVTPDCSIVSVGACGDQPLFVPDYVWAIRS